MSVPDVDDNRPPLYYKPGEVRVLRDQDRRSYRNRTIALLFYQIVTMASIRFAFDFFLSQKSLESFAFAKSYVIIVMIGIAILLWAFGIIIVFKRRY